MIFPTREPFFNKALRMKSTWVWMQPFYTKSTQETLPKSKFFTYVAPFKSYCVSSWIFFAKDNMTIDNMTHTLPFGFVRPVCRILHTPGAVHGPTGQAGASLDPGPRMVRWTGGHTLYPIPSPGCTAWQMWPHEWTTARDVQAVIAAPLVKTF